MSMKRCFTQSQQCQSVVNYSVWPGSVEPVTEVMWVYNSEEKCMVQREISYVPGLYKIFDEILVNAADNKQRDKKMDTIKINIDP